MEKLLLILNPISGTKKSHSHMMDILKVFNENNMLPTVYLTRSKGDATDYVAKNAKYFDRVVCCGGDGTFSETVSGLIKAGVNIPLGYIPSGTTNDLAKTLGIPSDFLESAKTAALGDLTGFDIGTVNGEINFSYVASFGVFTKTSYSTPQSLKNALGHLAYLIQGVKELVDIPSYKMTIKIGEEEHTAEYIFGAITNSLSMGGVIKLSPDAVSLNDGEFEAMFIKRPSNVLELGKIATHILDGSYKNKNIIFRKLKNVKLTCDEAIPWTFDGEFGGDHKEVTIENLYSRVTVSVPKKAENIEKETEKQ